MRKILILVSLFVLLNGLLQGFDSKILQVIYQSKTPAAYRISLTDKYALISSDFRVHVYSISNIWKPELETAFASTYPISDVFCLDNNHIYVCSQEPTNEITEIDSLNKFGRIFVTHVLNCSRASREGATLYTSHTENGLEIFDIGKGVGPQLISVFAGKWGFWDMEARYPYVHALNDFGYVILDISDLKNPRSVGTNYEVVGSKILCLNKNIAWVNVTGGLAAIEYSNPEKPIIITRYSFASEVTAISAQGDDLFIGLKSGGLKILDITNPRRIKEKNSFYLRTTISDIALTGDYIYLGAGNTGWYILEYR